MQSVPDELCLHRAKSLDIVMTGGSSAVRPIRDAIKKSVRLALHARELEGINVRLESARSTFLSPRYNDVVQAQLAVSLGASHPQFTELKYYEYGLRAVASKL